MFSVLNRFVFMLLVVVICTSASSATMSLNSILKDTPTTRTIGMGNAFTGVAEAESAIFFNPAGLAIPGGSYTIQQLDYDKINYETYYGNFIYASPFGFSNIQLKDYAGNSAAVNVIAYGRQGQNGISWGLNQKSVTGVIDSNSIDGWSSDFGLLVNLTQSLTIGFTAKDFYQKNLDVPTTFSTGFSWLLFDDKLRLAQDVYLKNDDHLSLHSRAGMELNITDGLVLRSGAHKKTFYTGANISTRLGQFDFGIIKDFDANSETLYSLAYQFGKGAIPTNYRRRKSLFKPSSYASFSIGSNLINGQSSSSLFGGNKLGSNDLLSLINFANKDASCKGYIIRISRLGTSLSSIGLIEEIRKELAKGKKKGKKIFAYIESDAGLSEYYLASIADMIFLPQLGSIQNIGIHYEITQATKLLENFGLKSNTISSGRFKASNRLFSEPSDELDITKVEDLVDSLFSTVISTIMKDRDLSQEAIDYISKGGVINADEALVLGLVDQLSYWSDVHSVIEMVDDQFKEDPLDSFIPYRTNNIFDFNKIAVVEIDGAIGLGDNLSDMFFGNNSTGADEFDQIVEYLKESIFIKGVILRVNSPGGGVLASDRIYHSIQQLKQAGKTVYTSMGNIAASGGYYVSVNSDKIFANPSTITGSIGVISSFISSEFLEKEMGITKTPIKTGEFMDLYSTSKALDDEKRQLLQQNSDFYYEKFVEKVKSNRQMTQDEVYDISQGQVFTGNQAVEFNIVDQLGGFYDVVDDLSSELDISEPQLVYFRKKGNLFSQSSLESTFKTTLLSKLTQPIFSTTSYFIKSLMPRSDFQFKSLIQ